MSLRLPASTGISTGEEEIGPTAGWGLEAVLEPERAVALDDLAVDLDDRVAPTFFRSGDSLRSPPLAQKRR
ncbi:hypothetical protein [Salinilacihabitans rarus]|uniref:hypothetical protein n=1 Tax=Salinilacihabitans rarus TaxID=2961596 RepID=UPI0020C87524|nr:hypothetical protein [Salinilacihabitans rarus]